MPPDRNARAGKKRGSKSGKVADFRYKRPHQPDLRKSGRDGRGNGAPSAAKDAGRPAHDLDAIGTLRQGHPGEAYAALDLGTNNCRLLIARPSGRDFTVIDAFSRVVKLGEGLATSGRLSDKA
ncbi:MAG: Ppx/GppA family phosphatase, partial [Porphyrobacter sp.]|nr:Ppx/GppA family phosphatase [Porphyrobacter sp.]